MDKKYLVVVRVHNSEVVDMFGGEEKFVKQAEKIRLELEKTLTLGGYTVAMIILPDGVDIEISRID